MRRVERTKQMCREEVLRRETMKSRVGDFSFSWNLAADLSSYSMRYLSIFTIKYSFSVYAYWSEISLPWH